MHPCINILCMSFVLLLWFFLCFSCVFDSVKGVTANTVLITGIGLFMIVSLSIIYTLTWLKIHVETKQLRASIGSALSRAASLNSAKVMCFFIIVYLIQWTPLIIYSTWQLLGDVSFYLYLTVVISTNLGGVLSGIIFLITQAKRTSVSITTRDVSTCNTVT